MDMRAWILCAGLCLAAAGCSREAAYRSVVEDKAAAYEEMTALLKTIKDEASLAAARERIHECHAVFDAIAERGRKLGDPGADMRERLAPEVEKLNLAWSRYKNEALRVNALPGGKAFLDEIDDLILAKQP
jgi:hypothetical protein